MTIPPCPVPMPTVRPLRRRKPSHPVSIYWLVNTRTGTPFYCGKSVRPSKRLQEHIFGAERRRLPVHLAVLECGEDIAMEIVETIPVGGNWVDREKYWIATLRERNPNCANVATGGSGNAGYICTDAQNAANGERTRARCADPAYRAKLSAAHKGQQLSAEHREKAAAHLRRLTKTPEYQAANAARTKARWQDPEYRAKMIAAATGRKLSAEAREKVAASKRGKPLSAEHKAKVGNAHRGKTISAEHRAIVSARHKGVSKPKSEAHKAALRAGWARRRERLALEAPQHA